MQPILPLANVATPAMFGAIVAVIALIPIVLIESFVMHLLEWNTWAVSAVDAAISNIVSTVIGIFAVFILMDSPLVTGNSDAAFVILGIVPMWALSVLTESGTLCLIRRHSVSDTLNTMTIANVASYAGLILLYILMGSPAVYPYG